MSGTKGSVIPQHASVALQQISMLMVPAYTKVQVSSFALHVPNTTATLRTSPCFERTI